MVNKNVNTKVFTLVNTNVCLNIANYKCYSDCTNKCINNGIYICIYFYQFEIMKYLFHLHSFVLTINVPSPLVIVSITVADLFSFL